MAGLTDIRGVDVRRPLTGCIGTIMTTETVIHDAGVTEHHTD